MTFDRTCELCDDVCYQEMYGKKKINEFIPEHQKFNKEEIQQIKKQDIKNKVVIVKPFRYYDCSVICNECWEKWNSPELKSQVRSKVVKDWR